MAVLCLHRSHEEEIGEAAGRSLRHGTTIKTCRSQIRCMGKLHKTASTIKRLFLLITYIRLVYSYKST